MVDLFHSIKVLSLSILERYRIEPGSITVSGISSGAAMVTNSLSLGGPLINVTEYLGYSDARGLFKDFCWGGCYCGRSLLLYVHMTFPPPFVREGW